MGLTICGRPPKITSRHIVQEVGQTITNLSANYGDSAFLIRRGWP